jgi:hypothetical protein
LATKSKKRACGACGIKYSGRRPRCPNCGEPNDAVVQVTSFWPKYGILDLLPGVRDLPDSTKLLIAIFGGLLAAAAGVLVFFIISRG